MCFDFCLLCHRKNQDKSNDRWLRNIINSNIPADSRRMGFKYRHNFTCNSLAVHWDSGNTFDQRNFEKQLKFDETDMTEPTICVCQFDFHPNTLFNASFANCSSSASGKPLTPSPPITLLF